MFFNLYFSLYSLGFVDLENMEFDILIKTENK